jgi:hypothetical protein
VSYRQAGGPVPGLSREPVLTLAVKTLLVARQGLEPDHVYELAMALSNQLLHEAEAASAQTGPGQLNTKPS